MATAQTMGSISPDINTRYAYVLAKKNERRGGVYNEAGQARIEQEYPPSLNILFTSSIVWPGGKDPFSGKERQPGRYSICYYDGCTTLFVDEQPREFDTLKQLKLNTREIGFGYGFCFIMGYDKMLKIYMDWASYNENSPYRVPSVEIKWMNVDTERDILSEGELMDMEDRVRELATKAPLKKMMIHAKFLGIATQDPITNIDFSEKAIRVEYRKAAKANPKFFESSYNDKSVEVRTWIREAFSTGTISTSLIPGKVLWTKGRAEIMDTMGLKAEELIIDKLAEFTQVEDGADFLAQLKALYS